VAEHLDDVGVLAAHLLDLEVLVVVDVLELVVVDEPQDAVRRDVPRARNPDAADGVGPLGGAADHGVGQQQPGTLAAELALAVGRRDRAPQHVVVVADADEPLRLVHELDVVGQQPACERDADAGAHRGREREVGGGGTVVALERLVDLGDRRVVAVNRVDEEGGLVVLDPLLEVGGDLGAGEAARRDLERLAHRVDGRRQVAVVDGAVFLSRAGLGQRPRALEQRPGVLDAAPAQVVEHPAPDPRDERGVGAPEELEDDPPLVTGRQHGELSHVRRATCDVRRATCDVRTCDVRRANVRRATVRRATVRRATVRRATVRRRE
jgi:hypothetical protein